MVKHLPTMRETWVQSLGREDLLEKGMEPTSALQVGALPTELPGKPILVVWVLSLSVVYLYHTMGFPGGSEVKASVWNAGDPGSIPGSGRSPGEGNDNSLQYSCHHRVVGKDDSRDNHLQAGIGYACKHIWDAHLDD